MHQRDTKVRVFCKQRLLLMHIYMKLWLIWSDVHYCSKHSSI